MDNLKRFIDAQATDYESAFAEIKNGRKRSHWMWYIFPQIYGLGFSATSQYYGIQNEIEAAEYLAHPVLGKRLVQISKVLLDVQNKTAAEIFGNPDDLKLRSSMTLFAELKDADPVFQQVLDKYYNGTKDSKTLLLLKQKL